MQNAFDANGWWGVAGPDAELRVQARDRSGRARPQVFEVFASEVARFLGALPVRGAVFARPPRCTP